MFRCVSPAALVLVVLSAGTLNAQTADQLVAKNLEAKGGVEKWKAINSLRMIGTISVQGKQLPLTISSMRPNYMRHEMNLPDLRIVQAFDGKTAWAINPMLGATTPQQLPAEAAETIRTSAEFEGALVNYKAKGHVAELVGTETLGGRNVHHLKLTLKNGPVQHFYLDAETGLEVRVTQEVETGPGQKQALASEMSNYQPVSGILIPHTVRQLLDGKVVAEMTISKVEINAIDDPSLFRMPAK